MVRVYSRQRENADDGFGKQAVPLEHLALHKLAESSPTAKSEEMMMLRKRKQQVRGAGIPDKGKSKGGGTNSLTWDARAEAASIEEGR